MRNIDSVTAILWRLGQELSGSDLSPLGLCASSQYAGEMVLLLFCYVYCYSNIHIIIY